MARMTSGFMSVGSTCTMAMSLSATSRTWLVWLMTTVTDIKEKEEGFGLNKSGGGNSTYFQQETEAADIRTVAVKMRQKIVGLLWECLLDIWASFDQAWC